MTSSNILSCVASAMLYNNTQIHVNFYADNSIEISGNVVVTYI